MPPHPHDPLLNYLPLLIVVPILLLRMRRMTRAQPLKWQYLWVRPAIFLALAGLVLATTPPHAGDLPWLLLAAVLGGAAGWQWGRTMAIEMHPENGTLMARGGQAAMLVLIALVVVRMGLRTGLEMEAKAWHLDALLLTDASIVFSALLFAVRGLEMFLRARRVMEQGARPGGAGRRRKDRPLMEPLNYNRLAGKNLGRLEALSDGVFAVAMTLLVLDLKAPVAEAVHSEHDLLAALLALSPRLLTYLMSFVTLGIFWLGQQAQFNLLERSNRDVVWLHIGFLAVVCLIPFSTSLLAEFIAYRTALLLYWANIFFLGVLLLAAWRLSRHFKVVKPELPADIDRAICRRIIVAQLLYAVGGGRCA